MGKKFDGNRDSKPGLGKKAEVETGTSSETIISRRTFFKIAGSAAAGLAFPPTMGSRLGFVNAARAAQSGNYDSCRIVVFGSDSLRIDYAQQLHNDPTTALSSLYPPICAESAGESFTQAGWASIWSGLPSEVIKAWSNRKKVNSSGKETSPGYRKMKSGFHIMEKLMNAYSGRDLYPVWITGKGRNIRGICIKSDGTLGKKGPHYWVYRKIVEDGHQGIYKGDESRENQEVYNLAYSALTEAIQHENFLAFVHFGDPDDTGHKTRSFVAYMDKAYEVDSYIDQLLTTIAFPSDTNVIYCSDHGFDFISQGDPRDHHQFSPYGMLSSNVLLNDNCRTSQMSIGRLIYKLAGGNPDWPTRGPNKLPYKMFGCDLI